MKGPNDKEFSRIPRTILRWFDRNRRELPFRQTGDPYQVWVSEIMLQQTRVNAVVPYFQRFIQRFPTVGALAEAELDEVLRLWAGLGYYRRARYLHEGARQLLARHGGRFPHSRKEVLAIPGIGKYTAGAILSIAFGQREPVLDGNVIRVLSRVFEVRGNPRKGAANLQLWHLAQELIPEGRAGDFNQGLMELGALVCTPAAPKCAQCPISKNCRAFERGTVQQFPQLPARPKAVPVQAAAAVILRGNRALLARKHPDQVLGGLWVFPMVEKTGKLPPRALLARRLNRVLGVKLVVGALLVSVRHTIMNRRFHLESFLCSLKAGEARLSDPNEQYERLEWYPVDQLASLPLPSASQTVARALKKHLRQL